MFGNLALPGREGFLTGHELVLSAREHIPLPGELCFVLRGELAGLAQLRLLAGEKAAVAGQLVLRLRRAGADTGRVRQPPRGE